MKKKKRWGEALGSAVFGVISPSKTTTLFSPIIISFVVSEIENKTKESVKEADSELCPHLRQRCFLSKDSSL